MFSSAALVNGDTKRSESAIKIKGSNPLIGCNNLRGIE
ncbi:MAG: hypothetical protein OFPI_11480 [Osedax symbiont Rs2]|nr:MAG: hypothetical protein OFPI_11480 [Osedax symbiont Rs2]